MCDSVGVNNSHTLPLTETVCVIGAGPAGLMAAEALAERGRRVDVYDSMPSVGRKFLLAGKGGLNLTHSENSDTFLSRYRERAHHLAPYLRSLDGQALRDWAQGLGVETFVGSSGRVFPKDMKAAPLLRAWLHRLRGQGVRFHMRHRWVGWASTDVGPCPQFESPQGASQAHGRATVLALGGGSWARLGSDGTWVNLLRQQGILVHELQASNCGFEVNWTDHFRSRFEGAALKSVALHWHEGPHDDRVIGPTGRGLPADAKLQRGEFVITAYGVEGSLIYAASAALRREMAAYGTARIQIDLLPHKTLEDVLQEVRRPRGSRSWSTHLKSRLGLDGVKAGLLREVLSASEWHDAQTIAQAIKGLPLQLLRPRPLDEAISSAGGVAFEALTADLMLRQMPGVFVAGEMLDWEAPTGGYLLTACMATGRAAGTAAAAWVGCKS